MNASTFAQLLLLWQRELHRLDSFLQLHLAFRQFPVQLHLGTPWPPPMLSSLAAVLRGTTLAMFTSSGFRNDVKVGENWFRLYTDSSIPVAQPNLQRISISKIRTKLLLFWSCLKFTCTSRRQFSQGPHISGLAAHNDPCPRQGWQGEQLCQPQPRRICSSTSPPTSLPALLFSFSRHLARCPWWAVGSRADKDLGACKMGRWSHRRTNICWLPPPKELRSCKKVIQ